MAVETKADGVHGPVARDAMASGARKLRDCYERVAGAPLYRREFWLMQHTIDKWQSEEGMPRDVPWGELFHFDPEGKHALGQLGWCEAAFCPGFEHKVIEDRGDHEVVQDHAGRHVLFFKGRRLGFMPEYLDHPVKDRRTWEEDVKWRLAPDAPERYADLGSRMAAAREAAGQGMLICQNLIGGYMYLRSLIGPETLLYAFYDMPEVIHDCMDTWLRLSDTVIARHQEAVTLDEVFFAEDICYNHGPLISPEMMREFLLPYYQELLGRIRRRQIDTGRHLYIQVDTDGLATPTIPLYQEIGMDVMSPFEVASGCDVVAVGEAYPTLVLSGGIDKRVLARSKGDIDRMVERILPPLRERGGYIPTVDHGTPPEVPYENYLHYRARCIELGG